MNITKLDVNKGEFDFFIEGLIKHRFTDKEIVEQTMNLSNDYENSTLIGARTKELRTIIINNLKSQS